jgi:predicted metalloprotease with PDZ domain
MLARTLTIAALASAFAGALPAQPADSVHYTLAPVMEGGALTALAVEIRFTGDEDGETRLDLPNAWAGSDSLWSLVQAIEVDGATSVREDVPQTRRIAHAPGAPLRVRYRVAPGHASDPGTGYRKARPIIQRDWFFFHGEGVFASPGDDGEAPAGFSWGAFPDGWKVVSDLDHLRTGARPGVVNDVVESTAIGAPDLAVLERTVGGAPVRFGVRGPWTFTADAFADAVAGIMEAENRLWGDAGRPFAVALAPLGDGGSSTSYTGTAREDGFSVASTSGFELGEAARFLAHEYMHTWIVAELGGLPEEDNVSAFWFSEGWTDFYAPRALLRAGIWTPADYAAELDRLMLRNGSSPVRHATSAELSRGFWSGPEMHQLPYDRGHLLALLFDYIVRGRTGGRADMDDVMQAVRRMARRPEVAAAPSADAATLLPYVLEQEFGVDVIGLLALHLDGGEPVILPADLFGECARLETIEQPEFTRGFDHVATTRAGNVVTGVDTAGPAYPAGLRDGMRLLRRDSGVPGDASVELVYVVDDGGTERVIRYMPVGRTTIRFQRVHLTPDASTPACTALMSGG